MLTQGAAVVVFNGDVVTPPKLVAQRPFCSLADLAERRIAIEMVEPEIDGGRFEAKDTLGSSIAVEADIARQLGLGLGDEVTVNVLGRNITARIANLRQVDWESLAINFVMVFTPSALKGAPHNLLATITLPSALAATGGGTVLRPEAAERQAADDAATEAAIARALARGYPSVTPIRVKDAINAFTGVFEKVMIAIRTAGAVTLVAGALVLAGALATAQRRRIHQAVVLKVLGATRRRLLATHLIEYALLALVTAGLATLVGGVAAWIVVTYVMKLTFTWSWLAVAQALAAGLGLVAVFGSIGTLSALRSRPVPVLRS